MQLFPLPPSSKARAVVDAISIACGAIASMIVGVTAYLLMSSAPHSRFAFPIMDTKTVVEDSTGRLYVGDFAWSRIQVYSHEGRFLEGWPIRPSTKEFQLELIPGGIGVTGYFHRFYRYDLRGHLLGIDSSGTHEYESTFGEHPGLAVDGSRVIERFQINNVLYSRTRAILDDPWWFLSFPVGWLFMFVSVVLGLLARGFPKRS